MEIENHKEEVPFAFYEEKFRALRHPGFFVFRSR